LPLEGRGAVGVEPLETALGGEGFVNLFEQIEYRPALSGTDPQVVDDRYRFVDGKGVIVGGHGQSPRVGGREPAHCGHGSGTMGDNSTATSGRGPGGGARANPQAGHTSGKVVGWMMPPIWLSIRAPGAMAK